MIHVIFLARRAGNFQNSRRWLIKLYCHEIAGRFSLFNVSRRVRFNAWCGSSKYNVVNYVNCIYEGTYLLSQELKRLWIRYDTGIISARGIFNMEYLKWMNMNRRVLIWLPWTLFVILYYAESYQMLSYHEQRKFKYFEVWQKSYLFRRMIYLGTEQLLYIFFSFFIRFVHFQLKKTICMLSLMKFLEFENFLNSNAQSVWLITFPWFILYRKRCNFWCHDIDIYNVKFFVL